MQLTKISNLFCRLAEQSTFFKNYHFGYHSDINTNIINKFNPDGAVGTLFPLVLWAAPVEGNLSALNGKRGTNNIQVSLYFYDLQGRDQQGNTTQESLLTVWDRLHTHAIEYFNAALRSNAYTVQNKTLNWFVDANTHNDRLICVGLDFTIELPYACEDYEVEGLQPVEGCELPTLDMEQTFAL